MLYLLVYGDKASPEVDVILCDNHPERTNDGTLIFRNEGQQDFYVYPGDYLSIQHAYFGGKDAKPSFLFDLRDGALALRACPWSTRGMCDECLR